MMGWQPWIEQTELGHLESLMEVLSGSWQVEDVHVRGQIQCRGKSFSHDTQGMLAFSCLDSTQQACFDKKHMSCHR